MNGTTFDALAGVVRQAVGADRDTLATKADLDTGLAALEARLTVRLFGGLFAVAGLNVAAMAALESLRVAGGLRRILCLIPAPNFLC